MKLIILENWGLTVYGKEPRPALFGNAYGHPFHYDGNSIISSMISSVKDGLIITASGTHYMLGETDKSYNKIMNGLARRELFSHIFEGCDINALRHWKYVDRRMVAFKSPLGD